MTKQELLNYCAEAYGTVADHPFAGDPVTTVLRHSDTRKWYGIVMRVSRCKFGSDRDEMIDIVNIKRPLEMFGSFDQKDGVYPAFHMNKLHWASVLLPDAPDDIVKLLIRASFEASAKKQSRGVRGNKRGCL